MSEFFLRLTIQISNRDPALQCQHTRQVDVLVSEGVLVCVLQHWLGINIIFGASVGSLDLIGHVYLFARINRPQINDLSLISVKYQ